MVGERLSINIFFTNWWYGAEGYNDDLLLSLKKYILLRKSASSLPQLDLLSPRSATELENKPEILSHVAWLSEEILRASEEKVNLAQASYDSVSDLTFSFSH
jgi:hypothetical protein